jgi:hypothetical protein
MRDAWKALDTQTVGDFCIKYDILFSKNLMLQISVKKFVVVSQKNPF